MIQQQFNFLFQDFKSKTLLEPNLSYFLFNIIAYVLKVHWI